MAKINVLDKHMAELIAAGEVVERPSSIVKELTENAVDAGATSITIEIQRGGIQLIRVTDNGSGIERDDVAHAFMRHATSKVRVSDDLSRIHTMGFRGEALASIAAMCKVEVITRTEDEIAGTFYSIIGGEEQQLQDAGCPIGTTITVRDVFYNTPARMKFLKKDVSEGNSVAAVIEKAALANPAISYRFIRDGVVKMQTPGDNQLISAVRCVLGRKFAENCIPIHYEHEELRLDGCICKPFIARGSRTMQNFFINSRYIQSKTCMAALEQSYRNMLMVGKFPSCVLNVTIPTSDVDVNVHPAKIEVRFANEKNIFDLIYYGCKTALGASMLQPQIKADDVKEDHSSCLDQQKQQIQQKMSAKDYHTMISKTTNYHNQIDKLDPEIFEKPQIKPIQNAMLPKLNFKPLNKTNFTNSVVLESGNLLDETYDLKKTKDINIAYETDSLLKNDPYENAILIGELFNTYIVLQNEDEMILIDKHAAHERLLFNRLVADGISKDRQMLLSPVTVKLTPEELEIVLDNKEMLSNVGLAIDNFGDGYIIVREIAPILEKSNIEEIVTELAQKLLNCNQNLIPSQLENLYHTIACKAAIKANDKTPTISLQQLVKLLREDGNATHCPHGRPVAIHITRHELEKKFGRLG